jgi:ketol-acid reductoisomerase
MQTTCFEVETITLDGVDESIVRGGRHLLPLVGRTFREIERIAVIGWGSQAAAQSRNLRDSLTAAAVDVPIVVGLREGSASRSLAEDAGFPVLPVGDAVATSDLVLLLVSDAALAAEWPSLLAAARPGTTIGLSHGFLEGWFDATGVEWPNHLSVIAVCPKGMGPSVRRLYELGSGINCSVAVHRDVDGRATDLAIAWAIALGAPYVFETTLIDELRSDLCGERAILLGVPHAIVEVMFRRLVAGGLDEAGAFQRSTTSLTGATARLISRRGLAGLATSFAGRDLELFERAYRAAYAPIQAVIAEIYDEIASGNELTSVVMAADRLERWPMPTVSGSGMWAVGDEQRAGGGADAESDPLVSGLFAAAMAAQIDLLRERGHSWSEIVNESVIEIVDSLIPYMHHLGIAGMIDSCSVTARLGARKWAPRFEAALVQCVFPILEEASPAPPPGADDPVAALWSHPLHAVFDALADLRPPISLFDEDDAAPAAVAQEAPGR